MTRFLHIDPKAQTVTPVLADDPHNAIQSITSGNVDHGVVFKTEDDGGVAIIVYEYGLMEGDGPYFELRGRLYSGDAILYAFDQAGETVDMPAFSFEPRWLPTKEDVELAIAAGVVARPQTSVNGAVLWRWGR